MEEIRYSINEIFASVQGEGLLAGTPAVFVRLQGCPVHCPWCDTKYSWKEDGSGTAKIPLSEVLVKDSRPRSADATLDELVNLILERWPRIPLVVITGGEPAEQPIRPLTERLIAAGKRVSLETSGFLEIDVAPETFVTVSRKITVPGGRVLDSALERADEVKMVIGDESDLAALDAITDKIPESTPISLQPLSMEESAASLCFRTAVERGGRYRVSVQLHKVLRVR